MSRKRTEILENPFILPISKAEEERTAHAQRPNS